MPISAVRDPDTPVLAPRSYSSPLSFTGATTRIIRAANRSGPVWVRVLLLGIVVPLLLACAWTFIAGWYLVIFGCFGIIVFPWRLHRRSQRKAQHLAEAQLALLQRVSADTRR